MSTITKKDFLTLINEQLSSMELDEMPNRRKGEEHPIWTNPVKLPEPKIFRKEDFYSQEELDAITRERGVPKLTSYLTKGIGLMSLNPDIKYKPETEAGSLRSRDTKYNKIREDEGIRDVAVCYRARKNKLVPEFTFYLFDNYAYKPPITNAYGEKEYQKKEMFILVSDNDPNRPLALLGDLKRHPLLSSQWERKSQISPETWAKTYLHYPKINELFNREDIKVHLYKCGLPPIVAAKTFDQPITHKLNNHKYSPPDFSFLLSGIWPAKDIQDALDLIIQYREAVALGDEPPQLPPPTHMPRNPRYPTKYTHGNWEFAQKIAGNKNLEQTKKLRLWQKAIEAGLLSFYIGTDLQVFSTVEDNDFIMTATFSSVSETRTAGQKWANYKVEPITPVSVHIRTPIPEGISLEDEGMEMARGGKNTREYQFLSSVYDNLLNNLGDGILGIDEDVAINNYLMFELSDVTTELDEGKTPKKIMITENQLKKLIEQQYDYDGNIFNFFDKVLTPEDNSRINELLDSLYGTDDLDERMEICDEMLLIIQDSYPEYYDYVEDDIKELTLD